MAKRNTINKYVSTSVAASSNDDTEIGNTPIEDGRTFRITCFGAALPAAGQVELQLRTRVTPTPRWRTLRAIIGPGHMHYHDLVPVAGDAEGIAALRIRRANDDTNPQRITTWIEGFRNSKA